MLSKFYGRDVSLSTAVVLPAGYEANSTRHYPTIFTVPGFERYTLSEPCRSAPAGTDAERGGLFSPLVLDPSCPLGHHVFADSANNGPVGEALIREFLPAFDRTFRSVADPGPGF